MDIQTAKQIKIADYLHSLGFSPVKQQEIWHMLGTVEFLCQCDDVTTLAECKIIPLIALGIYLERGFRFFPKR